MNHADINSFYNILLVDTPYKGERAREPLGLAYIAGALREHAIPTRILCKTNNFDFDDRKLLDIAADYNIIGFSATTPTFGTAARMARLIKEANPSVCIVLGGYHGTLLHETIMKKHTEFDVVIRGEGERSFIEYLNKRSGDSPPNMPISGVTHRCGDKVFVGKPRPLIADLDTIAPAAIDLLPPREEFPLYYDHFSDSYGANATYSSSRGCTGKCTFCSIIRFYGRSQVRYESPQRVLDNIERIVTELGVKHVHFCDDSFLASIPRAQKIFEGISKRGLKVCIKFNARSDQIIRAREVLPAFVDYGLRIVEIGVENGCQSVLNRYGKRLTVEDNIKALSILKELNLRILVDYILFDPWTNLEELETNLSFLKKHLLWDYDYKTIVFNRLRLLPGTVLFEKAIKSKLYVGDPLSTIKPLFKDPDIGEIYYFIKKCKKEGNDLTKEKENSGHDTKRDELPKNILNAIINNRLPLILLGKTIALKKYYLGQRIPLDKLQKIRDGYLGKFETIRKNSLTNEAFRRKRMGYSKDHNKQIASP